MKIVIDAFYTPENAMRIDGMIDYIHRNVPDHLKPYCLGPLVVKASIHTNTSGVFKGFHKGGWGGKGGHAVERNHPNELKLRLLYGLRGGRDVYVHRRGWRVTF